jgi:hypothetical protein
MDCKKPLSLRGIQFGCGQCLPCRINKRREWTHRLLLESKYHEKNSFITLTYSPENIPLNGSLKPEDPTKFLKRLREKIAPQKLRYYLVGEYGDNTFRPHYHLACFGLGPEDADTIQSAWDLGHTYTGTLTQDSAQYVAGYVTKKMTSSDDPRLIRNGIKLLPEYARMSLKPALGSQVVMPITKQLNSKLGNKILDNFNDVPKVLQHGNKTMPLGRTIVEKLRDQQKWEKRIIGREYPQDILQKRQQKNQEKSLQILQDYQDSNTSAPSIGVYTEEKRKQKALQRETKHNLYNKRTL